MTADEVLAELSRLGNETTKRTFLRHGAPESIFGVKVEDLKKLQKRIKKDHELALALYATGNSDAMYLAGYVCEPAKMKKADLQRWAKQAPWYMISEYTVAWTAAESSHGWGLAREWIDSSREPIAATGWATLSSLVSLTPDEELDLVEIEKLLDRVRERIAAAPNRVRYTMNGFVIAVGCFVTPLTARARDTARALGTVEVDMKGTACKVPSALDYIDKIEKSGRQGRKRKSAFC